MDQLVNAISLGSIYALIALGYTMVYGIIRLINFAHGDILMLGAYIGFALISIFKLDFFTALILSMLSCALIGAIIERIAYKPLRKSAKIAVLITAIGVSYLIENLMIVQVGADTKVFPDVLGKQSFRLLGAEITLK